MKTVAVAMLAWSVFNCFCGIAQENRPDPQVVVYKTRGDYADLVPVTLSDDGSRIVSYPAVEDIAGKNVRPSKLTKGYLLDNGGRINKHVAFLKLSFEQYGKLKKLPSLTEMYGMLKDRKPIVELYDCGLRNTHVPTAKLNRLIRKHQLSSNCKKMD